MKLRIISGELKRRVITVKRTASNFRPTKEMVRKAVADYLQRRIRDTVVADFCAGSGAFGFEMLSRGAEAVYFIEKDRNRCRNIVEFAGQFNKLEQCQIICRDIRRYVQTCKMQFDIIYYDPPYDDLKLVEIFPEMLPLVRENGIFIYERRKKKSDDIVVPDGFDHETRVYGDTKVEYFLRKPENEKDS